MSEQPSRYQRSFGGLVGALVVLVAVIVGWVVFRGFLLPQKETAVRRVDYARVVPDAKQAAGYPLVAPRALPEGWRATSVRFTPGASPHWHLGVLTDEDRYVGLEQDDRSVASMVEEYVDTSAQRGRAVDVDGERWSTYTDSGGDLALVRRGAGVTTLVVGHAVSRQELVSYVASLR